jgi:hypothetical protein
MCASLSTLWGDWESGPWRFIGFESAVSTTSSPFDDTSNSHFRFHTLRVERQVLGTNELSAYYSFYQKDNVRYLDASGDEKRNVFDGRFAGKLFQVDWDLEAMGQTGVIGGKDIRAWAAGTRTGYTFAQFAWQPRLGLQMDAASGDRHPGDNVLGTFNPLFPNGYYFTLAGFTGYVNLITSNRPDGEAGTGLQSWARSAPVARDRRCDLRTTQHSGRRHRR